MVSLVICEHPDFTSSHFCQETDIFQSVQTGGHQRRSEEKEGARGQGMFGKGNIQMNNKHMYLHSNSAKSHRLFMIYTVDTMSGDK